MILTDEILEQLGVYSLKSKIYPNKYHVPIIGEMNITMDTKLEDILNMVYKKGNMDGIRKGKNSKIEEIKNILNYE